MLKLKTYHVFGRFVNDVALSLADRVTALGPIPDAKVFWTSGGSDSVDFAASSPAVTGSWKGDRTSGSS